MTRDKIHMPLIVACGIAAMIGMYAGALEPIKPVAPVARVITYTCLAFIVVAGGWLLFERNRADRAPDFLRSRFKTYFDTGTFSFAFGVENVGGVCYIVVYFQNRYERACRARVGIQSSNKLFDRTPFFPLVLVEIDCPGGAVGKTAQPVAVPPEAVGRDVIFDVGASADFPDGLGSILRFRRGILVRHDEHFNVTIPSDSIPALVTLKIPYQVEILPPLDARPRTEFHWKLGDPSPPESNSRR